MPKDTERSAASARRVVGKPFPKGVSGCPGGRPKSSYDFATAARDHVPQVLEMFLRSLGSRDWRERHSAGTVLLDRALGKPTQPITGPDGGSVTLLHLFAMREIGERVIAELQSAIVNGSVPQVNGGNGAAIDAAPASFTDLSVPASE